MLLNPEDIFPPEVIAKAIEVTGHFHGWIPKQVRDRWGIEASAESAWEAEGGGKFSFKNPMGDAKITSGPGEPSLDGMGKGEGGEWVWI